MDRQPSQQSRPLMPRATAVWLIENTALTFRQIGAFCELHELEVQSIADDEVSPGIVGYDPIANGQLTREEISRCEADSATRLEMAVTDVPQPVARAKGPRYTPIARRGDKPDAIAWIVKNYPDMSDGQISRLIGTTKSTITAIRERTHWNMPNLNARDPVGLGLCARGDLDQALLKAGYTPTGAESAPAEPEEPAEAAPPSLDP